MSDELPTYEVVRRNVLDDDFFHDFLQWTADKAHGGSRLKRPFDGPERQDGRTLDGQRDADKVNVGERFRGALSPRRVLDPRVDRHLFPELENLR